VDGKEEAFPSYLKNAGREETCREFSTTEDVEDPKVIAGNQRRRSFSGNKTGGPKAAS
jgi:hypothetical protein